MSEPVRLGEILVRQGVLTDAQRQAVLGEQKRSPRPFGLLAEQMYGIAPGAIEQAWATQYAELVPPLASVTAEPEVLGVLDRRQAWQFMVVPMHRRDGELTCATTQAYLARALRFAGWKLAEPFHLVLASAEALAEALETSYPMGGFSADDRPAVPAGGGPGACLRDGLTEGPAR